MYGANVWLRRSPCLYPCCDVHASGLTHLCLAFLVVDACWWNDVLAYIYLRCLLDHFLQLCSENSRTLASCDNFFVKFRVLSILQSSWWAAFDFAFLLGNFDEISFLVAIHITWSDSCQVLQFIFGNVNSLYAPGDLAQQFEWTHPALPWGVADISTTWLGLRIDVGSTASLFLHWLVVGLYIGLCNIGVQLRRCSWVLGACLDGLQFLFNLRWHQAIDLWILPPTLQKDLLWPSDCISVVHVHFDGEDFSMSQILLDAVLWAVVFAKSFSTYSIHLTQCIECRVSRDLKLTVWFILNHMAAWNWMKSIPTTCFAIYGLSKAILRRPVMVLEGIQRGLKFPLVIKRRQRFSCGKLVPNAKNGGNRERTFCTDLYSWF